MPIDFATLRIIGERLTSRADTRKIKIAIIRVSLRKTEALAREAFFCRIRSVAIHVKQNRAKKENGQAKILLHIQKLLLK